MRTSLSRGGLSRWTACLTA